MMGNEFESLEPGQGLRRGERGWVEVGSQTWGCGGDEEMGEEGGTEVWECGERLPLTWPLRFRKGTRRRIQLFACQ